MRGRRRAPFEVGADAAEPARGGRRHGFCCESSRDRPVVRSSRALALATSPRQASAPPTQASGGSPEALRRPPDASPGSDPARSRRDPRRSGAIPERSRPLEAFELRLAAARAALAPRARTPRRRRLPRRWTACSAPSASRRGGASLFGARARATSWARGASTGPAERSGGHTTLTYDFTSAAPSVPRGPVGGVGSSRRAASRRARRPPRRETLLQLSRLRRATRGGRGAPSRRGPRPSRRAPAGS